MQITFTLNHKKVTAEIAADTVLLDLVRSLGCKSVKRGCDTANCGLCTVFLDEKPVLSCSVLAARVNGRSVTTLEGLQEEAAEFGAFIADQGAEQCGFCNPGFIMNALALFRENPDPDEDEIVIRVLDEDELDGEFNDPPCNGCPLFCQEHGICLAKTILE